MIQIAKAERQSKSSGFRRIYAPYLAKKLPSMHPCLIWLDHLLNSYTLIAASVVQFPGFSAWSVCIGSSKPLRSRDVYWDRTLHHAKPHLSQDFGKRTDCADKLLELLDAVSIGETSLTVVGDEVGVSSIVEAQAQGDYRKVAYSFSPTF